MNVKYNMYICMFCSNNVLTKIEDKGSYLYHITLVRKNIQDTKVNKIFSMFKQLAQLLYAIEKS